MCLILNNVPDIVCFRLLMLLLFQLPLHHFNIGEPHNHILPAMLLLFCQMSSSALPRVLGKRFPGLHRSYKTAYRSAHSLPVKQSTSLHQTVHLMAVVFVYDSETGWKKPRCLHWQIALFLPGTYRNKKNNVLHNSFTGSHNIDRVSSLVVETQKYSLGGYSAKRSSFCMKNIILQKSLHRIDVFRNGHVYVPKITDNIKTAPASKHFSKTGDAKSIGYGIIFWNIFLSSNADESTLLMHFIGINNKPMLRFKRKHRFDKGRTNGSGTSNYQYFFSCNFF